MTIDTAKPVTADDVKAAIGSGATNAAQIRAAIGRGSFTTIQKHIQTLRSEAAAQQQQQKPGEMPSPPSDLISSLWSFTWNAAQAQTADSLARALLRVRELENSLAQSQSDATENALLLDALEARAAAAEVREAELRQSLADQKAQAEAQAREHAKASEQTLNDVRGSLTNALSSLNEEKQGRALDTAKHEAVVAALRLETDRLVQQLADLKSFFSEKKK